MKNAFSIDVEDGISLAMRDFFKNPIPQTDQVVRCTQEILEILDVNNVKATFFILGMVAEEFPNLIKDISQRGHEIGVHGFNHIRFDQMTPSKATEELKAAKKILEDLTGVEVLGHRAPAFSINEKNAWALDVIAECGFLYDSSIMPTKSLNYGWKGYDKNISSIKTLKGIDLIEVPISTTTFLGRSIPYSGGSYLRLLPLAYLKYAFAKEEEVRPGILYIHPYEVDTQKYPQYFFNELKKVSLLKNLKLRLNWVNRNRMSHKLIKLTDTFDFVTIKELVLNYQLDKGITYKYIKEV